ncbi:MAG TPA: tRNA (adenosine(37)-N6)-threonylcarbamoyltransferase complex dimerization subunit type 1 TsaB [Burkholderiales bacterium]|nr:tRNA (adenosine(37)-N6)-threonylcarbamoyltransferase complex dimerization subunit type 1 TsaB [Burkholderiales bacterium]
MSRAASTGSERTPDGPSIDRPVLAFDTATPLGTIAIGVGDALLGEVTIGVNARHAESLLPAIDFVMGNAGVKRSDLGAIAVGAGPGSFTGVRIAGATAKGLAHALGLPLYAFSSLTMVAAGAAVADPVCVLFDARRGEVYAACHRFDQNPELVSITTLLPPSAMKLEAVVAALSGEDPFYIGEGAVRNAGAVRTLGGRLGPAMLGTPRASALLRLLRYMGERARVQHPARWTPEYLRAPGATPPQRIRPDDAGVRA